MIGGEGVHGSGRGRARSHTHTHPHSHSHSHTHTIILSHTHTLTHYRLTHSLIHTTGAGVCGRGGGRARLLSLSNTHTHTLTHSHTHTLTHSHTHTLTRKIAGLKRCLESARRRRVGSIGRGVVASDCDSQTIEATVYCRGGMWTTTNWVSSAGRERP